VGAYGIEKNGGGQCNRVGGNNLFIQVLEVIASGRDCKLPEVDPLHPGAGFFGSPGELVHEDIRVPPFPRGAV